MTARNRQMYTFQASGQASGPSARRRLNPRRIAAGVAAALLFSVTVPASAQHENLPPPGELPLDELRTFADVFNQIRLGYVEEVDDSTLLEYAIKGMLMGLDPHSVYLERDAFEDLQTSTSGEFSGLGLEVGMDNGYLKVVAPIDGSPAEAAGLQSGDVILKLDNTTVKGMSLGEAIDINVFHVTTLMYRHLFGDRTCVLG